MGYSITLEEVAGRFFIQVLLLCSVFLYYLAWKKIMKEKPQYRMNFDPNNFLKTIGFRMPIIKPYELIFCGVIYGLFASQLAPKGEGTMVNIYLTIFFIFVTVLLGPFVEELFFRGLFYDAFRLIFFRLEQNPKHKISSEIIFATLYFMIVPYTFAILHPIPEHKMIPGIIYALLFYSSKSLFPGWIAHMIFNLRIIYFEIFA